MDGKKRLSPYEVDQLKLEESRARDAIRRAEMRAMAEASAGRLAEQDAQDARQQATENEAAFRADELRKYLAAGGSESQFHENWPRLRTEIIERRYLSGESAPQSETAAAAKKMLDMYYKRPGG